MKAMNGAAVRRIVASGRELRICVSFPCLLDEYEVRRLGEEPGWWAVAESPSAAPVLQVSETPRCPRCGGELVPTPTPAAPLHRRAG